jgi:hypothetical protein
LHALRKVQKKFSFQVQMALRLRTDVPNGVNPGKGVHVGRNPITGPQAWAELLETLQKSWR